MNKYILGKAPLYFETLVIESSTLCNARCDICYQNAAHVQEKAQFLDLQAALRAICEASEVETIGSRLHLSGGECFLDLDYCLQAFDRARSFAYTSISVTTNAFWAKNKDCATTIARKCRDAGLTRIEISWDKWHAVFVAKQCVENCILAFYELGVEIVLRALSTKTEPAGKSVAMLDHDLLDLVNEIVFCPVMPMGRAAETFHPNDFLYTDTLGASCHHMLNFTVNAAGNVFPCCSGLDQNGNVAFGSVHEHSVKEIIELMNKSLLLKALVFQGPGSLVPIIEDCGMSVGRDYTTLCHLCTFLFSDKRMCNKVLEFFESAEKTKC